MENITFLVEAWMLTEVWTIGKISTGVILFLWLVGSIIFILWYLGKKIFSFGKG